MTTALTELYLAAGSDGTTHVQTAPNTALCGVTLPTGTVFSIVPAESMPLDDATCVGCVNALDEQDEESFVDPEAGHEDHEKEVHFAGAPGTGMALFCRTCNVELWSTVRVLEPWEVI